MNLTRINIGLGITAAILLVFYVVQTNALAAQAWRSRDAQDTLALLRDERNAIIAQQATLDDREYLMALAREAGMVPAGTVVYLVQDHSVAVR